MAHYDNSPDFNQSTETSTALAKQDEFNTSQAIARAQQEVQGSILVAQRFPRDENKAYAALLRACQRPAFAEEVEYSFPRGGNDVTGPSVNLAREAARVWGNIVTGFEITRDSETERQIRCFAWDMQTNARVVAEASFKKLIQRKRNGETKWIEPDERDLRELTNKHAAIGYRNCILQLIPKDFIEDAIDTAKKTLKDRNAADPDAALKRIVTGFDRLNISPEMIEAYLGHKLKECSPIEIDKLRGVSKSIADGNSTWAEHMHNALSNAGVAARSTEKDEALKQRMQETVQKKRQVAKDIQEGKATEDDFAKVGDVLQAPEVKRTIDNALDSKQARFGE